MHLFLFSIFAICIAGGKTQEIAIGTEYLRANFNNSLPSESVIHAQESESSSIGVVVDDTTTTTQAPKDHDHGHHHHHHLHDDHDHSSENHDDDHKKHGHEHHSHHQHGATVTIDVHHILDIFKRRLEATEERIIAAIQQGQSSNSAPVVKSYRTADRNNE
ncbi:unnamed protein product [Rotaria sp. Silwood1]|nr:unnamed protein product [Rotaria sp. Silwood1]